MRHSHIDLMKLQIAHNQIQNFSTSLFKRNVKKHLFWGGYNLLKRFIANRKNYALAQPNTKIPFYFVHVQTCKYLSCALNPCAAVRLCGVLQHPQLVKQRHVEKYQQYQAT